MKLAALAILCALAGVAIARPGGGQSYSGGSHSYGGGSHSGGGYSSHSSGFSSSSSGFSSSSSFGGGTGYNFGGGGNSSSSGVPPGPAVIVLIVVVALFLIVLFVGSIIKDHSWDSWHPQEIAWEPPPAPPPPASLDDIRAIDPDFSRPVFEDFAFRLYATAQRARTDPKALAAIAPYVSETVRTALANRASGQAVQQVVVGTLVIRKVSVDHARVLIDVRIEANVQTTEHTYFSVERWTFGRAASARSKPPGRARTFPCPNCGAPWQEKAMGTQMCASCGEVVDNGRFDWAVEMTRVDSLETHAPDVTSDPPEVGTDAPTVAAPVVGSDLRDLATDDPEATEANLVARLGAVYTGLNTAWSNNDLKPARPFVSDALYDYLQYWIATYKHQGLRNALENMRITKTEVAKLERDKWYDAVTIRLWGTGLDYVVDTAGGIVRGSKRTERAYSEYWTLIRTAGKTGKPQTEPICNNCGAPLEINMAGECSHCGSHVTSGEFDWVLSKIEQDDSYTG